MGRGWVRPLLAGAGLTGAVAALNRTLRETSDLPHNHLGGIQRRWTWRGHEIFATEAGTGPLVLLVHGVYAGASSYEYRKLFPLLAKTHRVVAFDLLGCGLSDKPNIAYNVELFVEQIVDALGMFGPEPTTLVGSSLGAAFAIRAAVRASDVVKQLVVICPAGLGGVLDGPPKGPQQAVTALVRSPLAGEAFFNALSSKASIKWFLSTQTYAEKSRVTPEVVNNYYAVTHQPGARYVPAYFVGGGLNCNVARDLPFVEAPVTVLWGERTTSINPPAKAQDYLSLARDARLVTFPDSGMLPHEEAAQGVADAIDALRAPAAV
jgi:pimeloyl-ACP methyl ester carboxylesterase